jgi:hypothetical protein
MMERGKRQKRGVKEFFGKVHKKAGATIKDDKGHRVNFFSYADTGQQQEESDELPF